MPGFTELLPKPDGRLSAYPAFQSSLLLLRALRSTLHYVLLPYFPQLENLLAFALHAAFPRSLGGRDPTDYYASSVALLIFRLFCHSHLWLSD